MTNFQKSKDSLMKSSWTLTIILTASIVVAWVTWNSQSSSRNSDTAHTPNQNHASSGIAPLPTDELLMPLRVDEIPTYPSTTLVTFQDQFSAPRSNQYARNQHSVPNQRMNFGNEAGVRPANFEQPTSSPLNRQVTTVGFDAMVPASTPGPIVDAFGYDRPQMGSIPTPPSTHGSINCNCNQCLQHGQPAPAFKSIMAVDGYRRNPNREPRWGDADLLPWESLAYGEYIGPVRSPHLREYRVRVGDQLDFTFRQTREITQQAYRLGVGDEIAINSGGDFTEFNDEKITVLRDGTIQLRGIGNVLAANKTLERLQEEINQLYQEEATEVSPKMIIKVVKSETQLNDLIRTVDATAGQGGQFRTLTVSPDGTVQLPALGSVPAIGLSLDELGAEANARYRMLVQGLEVTPSLRSSAPTFAYVLGEANNPGRIQLNGPTTVMQLIAQAGGWRTGANLREIVVFRRDENWRLVATKLDLAAPLFGNAPHPSDDLWIRNNDIILLPKTPAQRVVDFIDIYFQRGLYGVFPSQGFSVNFDGVSSL